MMRVLLVFLVLLITNQANAQYSEKTQAKVDSLNLVIEKNPIDTNGVKAINSLTDLLYGYHKDTLLSMALTTKQRAEEGLRKKNLSDAEMRAYKLVLGDATSNIGFAYKNQGDFRKGLDYYFEALAIREKLNDPASLANSYNNIASIYNTMHEYQKAIEFYKKSLVYRKMVGEVKGMAIAYNNIGYTFDKLGNLDSTIWYYEKAHELYLSIDYKTGFGMTFTNLGATYKKLNDLEKAEEYLLKGLEIREKLGSSGGLFYSNHNVADLYQSQGKYDKALPYAIKSHELAVKKNTPDYLVHSTSILYKIYKEKGDFKKSLEMHEAYLNHKDSLRSKELQKDLIRIEFEHVYQKKAAADSTRAAEAQKVADAKLAAEQAENARRKQQSYFLYAGIALAAIFGFFVFNRFLVTRKQKDLIEEQKIVVEEKNQEILDSITYAKGIQDAILPSSNRLNKLLPDHFVYYKPKDIVAGDFYWVDEVKEGVVFAAADCTGHGVPGAMVSVVCHNALHRSVHEFGLSSPEAILDKTRELVIETFVGTDREVKDGMDISLCVLNTSQKTVKYAGANNNLYLIRSGELIEFKADKQPVGKHSFKQPFTLHEIALKEGDTLYAFTDGFPDQFGGVKGKKFKYKNFKELLLKNNKLSLREQHQHLSRTFDNWKGEFEQIDDVCVIGVRI